MKNITLTIFWTIIIGGSIFLVTNKLKTNKVEPTQEIPNYNTENPIDIENEIEATIDTDTYDPATEQNSKTFTENIIEADKLMRERYFEAAINSYKSALELNQNSIGTLQKLADAYLANNQAKLAEENFRKALEINGESNEIKFKIAISLLSQNKNDEAKEIIWELDSKDPKYRFYQALTLILYNKPFEAQEIFNELDKIENLDKEIKINLKIFLDKYQKFSFFTEEDQIYLELMLAQSFSEIKLFNSSILLLNKVIDKKSNYRDAWIILGYCYLNIANHKSAIEALTQAKDLNDEKPETLFYLGLSYFANQEIEKAIFYLEKSKSKGFKETDIINYNLAELYKLRENFKKSASIYEALIKKPINDINLYEEVVSLYSDHLKEQDIALKYAQKALSLFPDSARAYNLVAKVYLAKKSYSKAEKYLSQSISLDPKLAETYIGIGKFNEAQGQTTLAKEYYKQAYVLGAGRDIAKTAAESYNKVNRELILNNYQITPSNP